MAELMEILLGRKWQKQSDNTSGASPAAVGVSVRVLKSATWTSAGPAPVDLVPRSEEASSVNRSGGIQPARGCDHKQKHWLGLLSYLRSLA